VGGQSREQVDFFARERGGGGTSQAAATPHDVIARGTASPVVVTDGSWRVVTLNPAAEGLLGIAPGVAVGRPCHEVLGGRDGFGNRYCHSQCTVGTMAQRGESVRPFELDVTNASGETVHAACSVIVLNGTRDHRIIHILTPIPTGAAVAGSPTLASAPNTAGTTAVTSAATAATAARRYRLTAREIVVLRMLTQGMSCQVIADALFISLPTVRNHVHNLLRKMHAHSQVEAVSIAHREGLI